jgi:hypothetical protein
MAEANVSMSGRLLPEQSGQQMDLNTVGAITAIRKRERLRISVAPYPVPTSSRRVLKNDPSVIDLTIGEDGNAVVKGN